MKIARVLGVIAGMGWVLAGCSKQPETATAQTSMPAPDNAMTRYAEGLADDQRRAKLMEDRANRAIAKENDQVNQASNQTGNN